MNTPQQQSEVRSVSSWLVQLHKVGYGRLCVEYRAGQIID